MKIKLPAFLVFLFLTVSLTAQDKGYPFKDLNLELANNANAVVREEVIEIEIIAVDKVIIRQKRVVTVLNETGENSIMAYEQYDDNRKIKQQQAVVYDFSGEEIDKFKKNKFVDVAVADGFSLYRDDRVSYLDYTAKSYPFTVVYESEIQTNSSIFLPPWHPVPKYALSVEKSSYHIINETSIPIRFSEYNLDHLEVDRHNTQSEINYSVQNVPAFKYEVMAPELIDFIPRVKVALYEFALVGLKGKASNWSELGKWQYENLLQRKDGLSQATIEKVNALTAEAKSDIEKAKLVYQYVQDNTRYISVQLGIGGWEPMSAAEVDRLGYGDCKALTNFTHALLETQGIESFYTVVFAGEEKRDIDAGFSSMEGNHVILNLPQPEEDIWLECTSQTTPFNYLGDFTDNRNVLVIKPEGGEIVKTKSYSAAENLTESIFSIKLDKEGGFIAEMNKKTTGVPYGNLYHLIRSSEKEQKEYYLNKLGHLKGMLVENMKMENDRENQLFNENLKISGRRYASKIGKNYLLPIGFSFSSNSLNLPSISKRTLPMEISRGFTDKDVFNFYLPEGYELEVIPEDVEIKNRFGKYLLTFELLEDGTSKILKIKNLIQINAGSWGREAYTEYKNFMDQVDHIKNQKVVLVPIV